MKEMERYLRHDLIVRLGAYDDGGGRRCRGSGQVAVTLSFPDRGFPMGRRGGKVTSGGLSSRVSHRAGFIGRSFPDFDVDGLLPVKKLCPFTMPRVRMALQPPSCRLSRPCALSLPGLRHG